MDDDMCPNCVTPWKCNGPHWEDFEIEAARRYAAMTGMDLPIEERRAIARRNRDASIARGLREASEGKTVSPRRLPRRG